jgi:integrase
MGSRRKTDRHLPQRVYCRRGTYFFVDTSGKWHSLGRDLSQALRHYASFVGDSTTPTMTDVFLRYAADVLPTKAAATSRVQAQQLERLTRVFGKMPVGSITHKDVQRYADLRVDRAVSVHRELALLSHVFTYMRRWQLTDENPCRGIVKPKTKPRERYVTDAEYAEVYALAPPAIRIAMDLALLTGQRQADLLSLTDASLDLYGVRFTQGKTGKKILVRWSPALLDVVRRAPGPGPLIATRQGTAFASSGFQTAWQRLQRGLTGPRWTFHDLRAKSASDTHVLADAQARLGHGSPALTQRVYRRGTAVVAPLR